MRTRSQLFSTLAWVTSLAWVVSVSTPVSAGAPTRASATPGQLQIPGLITLLPGTALLSQTWSVVDGLTGADLQTGPWELRMPAGIFIGTTTVTVSSTRGATPQVELSLADQLLNHFLKPAQLTYHVPLGVNPSQVSILWWDPDTKVWVPVSGLTVDTLHHSVTVPLAHFSTYAAAGGRVGW